MTRDEAISIYLQHVSPFVEKTLPHDALVECAESAVATMVALGILKLDEPKSAISKKIEKACSLSATKAADWQRLVRGLELAGLRIVEK